MKKEIAKGALIGIVIPMTFIGLLYLVFLIFERKINTEVIMSGILFGIGLNALLVRRLFKKDKDYMGRGILLASFLFFIIWVVKFIL